MSAESRIVVLKFGGSVLESEDMLSRSAEAVEGFVRRGDRPVVVVSAMKGVTDSLIQLSRSVNPNISGRLMDEILSMGERTSARIFSAALEARGLKSVLVDPGSELWPIITDDRHLDANPIYDETERRVREKLLPLLEEGYVPVVCGFLGRTEGGEVTTIGRGGSDTTAILLGSCLRAREVVLVKDVETVFSSDPDMVEKPVPVSELDAEEAYMLASGGAKFLHAKALQYNREGVKIRLSSLAKVMYAGTVIDGGLVDLRVEVDSSPISMLTIVGWRGGEEELKEVGGEVRASGGRIVSASMDPKSLIVYVADGRDVLRGVHRVLVERGLGKAASIFKDLRMVVVKGAALETIPGMIQRVTQPLARESINIYGLVTIASSIRIFLHNRDVERAVKLIKQALMIGGDGG